MDRASADDIVVAAHRHLRPDARNNLTAGVSASPATNLKGPDHDRTGDDWVSRRVCANGVVCVSWQQASVGRHCAGARCDVHVDGSSGAGRAAAVHHTDGTDCSTSA